ncbi:hypothetical protein K4K59_001858 [Colletotrichum sp. SAR11_240]|nr:hypothetical protein K4K59_001858 [Colletotrichum sp. SAR11_240]
MASEHNPFRRKTTSTSFSSTPQPVTTSAFLESITSGISRDNAPSPPEVRPAKGKVVKREDSSDDGSDDDDDQFSKRFPELPDGLPEAAPLRIANAVPNHTPENPFGKTLQDLEGLTDGKASSGGTAKSLDVNAFKMLLLTGQPGAGIPAHKAQSQGDKAAEAANASGSDTSFAETPRSSTDIADRGIILASPPTKRKPPPPSSRHGRKISVQTPERPHISSETASPISPSDVNKPLPPAPSSYGGEGTEDVFAREAAGKIPDQDSPTPSSTPTPATSATNVPEEPGTEDLAQDYEANFGKGADILADLDALQREVDALRAQQAK